MTRQMNRRSFILLPLAILTALALTAAVLARHDAPPAAAVGENSLTFPDPQPGNVGHATSMRLDANGFPVIAYLAFTATNPVLQEIRVMHCNDVNCAGLDESIEVVHSTPFGVLDPALSLDSSGFPVVTFNTLGVTVVHCNDANCADGDDSKVTHLGSSIVSESDHVLAAGDIPVVVFRQNGLQMLRCANPNCTSFSNDPNFVIQAEPTGTYSIALDAAALPVIAHSGTGGLRLLHCNDANCVGADESSNVVDPAQSSRFVRLLLQSGNPVMAYTSTGLFNVSLARCNDPNCAPGGDTVEIVIADESTGMDLALDASGNPVMSYYRSIGNDTWLVHCNDAACDGGDETDSLATQAGTQAHANGPTSLALDAAGRPVVALYQGEGNKLAVLHCGDVNCSIPPLPTPTNTPTATNTLAASATHTPTSTPIPPTATHTPTSTPIPPTATHTPTSTPIPPTATHTPTSTPIPPTATHTPTNTAVPPTATHTPTNTPIPPTATNTATNTPVPPTATNTVSPTATPVGDRCADLNGDGRVNVGDMLRIAVQIFRPYSAQHDINRDGVVNLADLFAAARQFGPRRC